MNKRPLSAVGALALLDMQPFAIIEVVRDEKDIDDIGMFYTCIMATNINSEHCYLELLARLEEEVRNSIQDIPAGISLYKCDMYFYNGYNGYESDPFWEIVGHELLSTEPLEAAEES